MIRKTKRLYAYRLCLTTLKICAILKWCLNWNAVCEIPLNIPVPHNVKNWQPGRLLQTLTWRINEGTPAKLNLQTRKAKLHSLKPFHILLSNSSLLCQQNSKPPSFLLLSTLSQNKQNGGGGEVLWKLTLRIVTKCLPRQRAEWATMESTWTVPSPLCACLNPTET